MHILQATAEYMPGIELDVEDSVADGLIETGQAELAVNQVVYNHESEIPAEAVSSPSLGESQPEVVATQAALDHAEALGVDISEIQGTGKDGKVTKGDVEAALAAKEGE